MMRYYLITTLLLASALCAVAGYNGQAEPEPELAELLKSVQEVRSQVNEVDLTYTFEAVEQTRPSAVTHFKERLRWHDGLIVVDRWSGRSADDLTKPYAYVSAGYDGARWWTYRGFNKAFSFTVEPSKAADLRALTTESSGFAAFMGWYPCHKARYGSLSDNDLLSILESPLATLRPEKEPFGEVMCYVVDEMHPTGVTMRSVWLDPERGYMQVRRVTSEGHEWRAEEAVEAAPGIWIPSKAYRIVQGGSELRPDATKYRFEIETAKVNHDGLDPDDFNVMATLPEGTRIWDLDSGSVWMTSAETYEQGADIALSRAGIEPGTLSRTAQADTVNRDNAVWKNPLWLALMVGAFAAGIVYAVRTRR